VGVVKNTDSFHLPRALEAKEVLERIPPKLHKGSHKRRRLRGSEFNIAKRLIEKEA